MGQIEIATYPIILQALPGSRRTWGDQHGLGTVQGSHIVVVWSQYGRPVSKERWWF